MTAGCGVFRLEPLSVQKNGHLSNSKVTAMQLLSKIWTDPVGSKVIASAISAAILELSGWSAVIALMIAWGVLKWANPTAKNKRVALIVAAIGIFIGGIAVTNELDKSAHQVIKGAQITNGIAASNALSKIGAMPDEADEVADDISVARRESLDGSTWIGSTSTILTPSDGTNVVSFEITFHFHVRGSQVTGIGAFEHPDRYGVNQPYRMSCIGDIYGGKYLRLKYKHLNGVEAFGFIIFEIDQNSTRMDGKCLVLGTASQKIIVGTIEIRKAP
jgi:hypothetical protein